MDNLPVELFQRIARSCKRKKDISAFSATFKLAVESVRPVLFESIQIVAAQSRYPNKLSLSQSDLASLVRNLSFHFSPNCDLSVWHPILILFTQLRRVLLSTITVQLEEDRVQPFRDLLAGLSSLSTIRSLHIYGGNMPDVKDIQFHTLDCIHLLECSFPPPDTNNPPRQRWLPSTLSLGMCNWTSAQQFIDTRNVRTLVIDWPEMKAVLDCDFLHIHSLALQLKDYPEDIIDMRTIFHQPLENYSLRWEVSAGHFGEIVNAFPRFLQGMVTRNFSIKLIFAERFLKKFFSEGATFLPTSILALLPSANAIMFGISISYPMGTYNRRGVFPWKSYPSPQAWIEDMEQQLFAHFPCEGDGRVSGGIFWELSHHHHSWETPGRYCWAFLPPQEDRHRYDFPERVIYRQANSIKLPRLRA